MKSKDRVETNKNNSLPAPKELEILGNEFR